MKRRFTVLRRLLEAVAIAVVVAVLAGFGLANGQLSGFQDRAVDQFFPSAKRDPAVIVVGMDDKAIAEPGFGYPPWPRDKHAQIARQLTAAGAAVIVWDVEKSFAAR